MKRLLCILSNMNTGGAETFLMKLYRRLDKEKYQLDFCINVKEKCYYEDEIIRLGGRIFRIPSKSENLEQFKKDLRALIKNEKYEYVLRITSTAMGFMDMKIAKKAGANICTFRSSNSSDGASFKAKAAHTIGRILYDRYVDVRIAPSDLAARHTFGERAYKDGSVHILHNGVDLNIFKYDPDHRESIRNEFGISKDAFVVGHIGRFMVQKNHNFLLDVFSEIKKKDENALLLLVGGNGELENDVKNKVIELGIEKNVIFAGIRSDIPKLLSAMDVFVFPSLYEGMPNTVIEAQATGLPCVIADTITKEADITGLVKYNSRDLSDKEWSESVFSQVDNFKDRKTRVEDFISGGYMIENVVEEFCRICFGE